VISAQVRTDWLVPGSFLSFRIKSVPFFIYCYPKDPPARGALRVVNDILLRVSGVFFSESPTL